MSGSGSSLTRDQQTDQPGCTGSLLGVCCVKKGWVGSPLVALRWAKLVWWCHCSLHLEGWKSRAGAARWPDVVLVWSQQTPGLIGREKTRWRHTPGWLVARTVLRTVRCRPPTSEDLPVLLCSVTSQCYHTTTVLPPPSPIQTVISRTQ